MSTGSFEDTEEFEQTSSQTQAPTPTARRVNFTPFNTPGGPNRVSTTGGRSIPPPPPPRTPGPPRATLGGVTFYNPAAHNNAAPTTKGCTRERRMLLAKSDLKEFHRVEKEATAMQIDSLRLNIPERRSAETGADVLDISRFAEKLTTHPEYWNLEYFFKNIAFPEKDSNGNFTGLLGKNKSGAETVNLFVNWGAVSLQEVVDSAEFSFQYGYNPSYQLNEWMATDLAWSGTFLLNQMTEELERKITETLEKERVPEAQRKYGPVLFKALMDRLLSNDHIACKHLSKSLVNLNLYDSPIKGDIAVFVDTLLPTIKALRERATFNSQQNGVYHPYVPEELECQLLTILKSTGDEGFDSSFADEYIQKHRAYTRGGNPFTCWGKAEDILERAKESYELLTKTGEWNPSPPKGGAFAAASTHVTPGMKCFGCGRENCRQGLTTCPRHGLSSTAEGDKARAEFNEKRKKKREEQKLPKAHQEEKKEEPKAEAKKEDKKKSKWPPKPKKGEPDTAMIDGVKHRYGFKSKRWFPDKRKPGDDATNANPQNSGAGAPSVSLAYTGGNPTLNRLYAAVSKHLTELEKDFDPSKTSAEDLELNERLTVDNIDKTFKHFKSKLT